MKVIFANDNGVRFKVNFLGDCVFKCSVCGEEAHTSKYLSKTHSGICKKCKNRKFKRNVWFRSELGTEVIIAEDGELTYKCQHCGELKSISCGVNVTTRLKIVKFCRSCGAELRHQKAESERIERRKQKIKKLKIESEYPKERDRFVIRSNYKSKYRLYVNGIATRGYDSDDEAKSHFRELQGSSIFELREV